MQVMDQKSQWSDVLVGLTYASRRHDVFEETSWSPRHWSPGAQHSKNNDCLIEAKQWRSTFVNWLKKTEDPHDLLSPRLTMPHQAHALRDLFNQWPFPPLVTGMFPFYVLWVPKFLVLCIGTMQVAHSYLRWVCVLLQLCDYAAVCTVATLQVGLGNSGCFSVPLM